MLSEYHQGKTAGMAGCNLSVGNKPLGGDTREAPAVFQKNTELPADRTLLCYRQRPVPPSQPFPASTAGEDEDHVASGAADLRFPPGRQRHSRGALLLFFFFLFFN